MDATDRSSLIYRGLDPPLYLFKTGQTMGFFLETERPLLIQHEMGHAEVLIEVLISNACVVGTVKSSQIQCLIWSIVCELNFCVKIEYGN